MDKTQITESQGSDGWFPKEPKKQLYLALGILGIAAIGSIGYYAYRTSLKGKVSLPSPTPSPEVVVLRDIEQKMQQGVPCQSTYILSHREGEVRIEFFLKEDRSCSYVIHRRFFKALEWENVGEFQMSHLKRDTLLINLRNDIDSKFSQLQEHLTQFADLVDKAKARFSEDPEALSETLRVMSLCEFRTDPVAYVKEMVQKRGLTLEWRGGTGFATNFFKKK